MEIFPGDDITSTDIRRMLDELKENNLIIEYQIDTASYIQVTGWHHQKIDRPSYKYPPPTETIRRALVDRSPPEGSLREGSLREGKGSFLSQDEPSTNDKREKLKFSEDDRKTAEYIFTKILNLNPNTKRPNLDKWANCIRLMREVDKHSPREICELFAWANSDTFWRVNILSPDKLRKQWDTLTTKRLNGDGNGKNRGALSAVERVRIANGLDEKSDNWIDGEINR